MKDMLKAVRKLMDASGQEYPDAATAELYYALVAEEMKEFIEAETEVEELDGLLDIFWTLLGLALAKGWLVRSAWDEVARSNHSKIDPETGKCIKREDGKVLKPATYSPPSLERFLK